MHDDVTQSDWLDEAEDKIAEIIRKQFYYSRVHRGTQNSPSTIDTKNVFVLPPGLSHFCFDTW